MSEDLEAIRERTRHALEQTATRPIAGPPRAHAHTYMVTTSGLTSIRWCTTCGKSWKLITVLRHFQQAAQWEAIHEPDT